MTTKNPELLQSYETLYESLHKDFGTLAEVEALLSRKREQRNDAENRHVQSHAFKLAEDIKALEKFIETMTLCNASLKGLIADHRVCNCIWEDAEDVQRALRFCRELLHYQREHPGVSPKPVAEISAPRKSWFGRFVSLWQSPARVPSPVA